MTWQSSVEGNVFAQDGVMAEDVRNRTLRAVKEGGVLRSAPASPCPLARMNWQSQEEVSPSPQRELTGSAQLSFPNTLGKRVMGVHPWACW